MKRNILMAALDGVSNGSDSEIEFELVRDDGARVRLVSKEVAAIYEEDGSYLRVLLAADRSSDGVSEQEQEKEGGVK